MIQILSKLKRFAAGVLGSQVTNSDEEAQINGCQVVKREEAQIMVVKVLKDVMKA